MSVFYPSQPYGAASAHAHAEETADAKRLHAHIADQQGRFGTIHETTLGTGEFDIAPAGSADLVLTFRNLHNWMFSGYADEALAAVVKALKPGGILGIEEHRGRNDQPQDPKAKSGYLREDHAIALAQKAGFELVGSSGATRRPDRAHQHPSAANTQNSTRVLKRGAPPYCSRGNGKLFSIMSVRAGGTPHSRRLHGLNPEKLEAGT
jgi:predicted methyltransferase